MHAYGAVIWKKIPFLRLLIPFIAGIVIQWYVPIPIYSQWISTSFFTAAILIFSLLPVRHRFQWRVINGLMVVALYFSLGGVVAHYKNPRIDPHGIHILYQEKDKVVATLDEPPVEKTRSIKATATISRPSTSPHEIKPPPHFSPRAPPRSAADATPALRDRSP